eukprot:2379239-Rhodomonas_salina.1
MAECFTYRAGSTIPATGAVFSDRMSTAHAVMASQSLNHIVSMQDRIEWPQGTHSPQLPPQLSTATYRCRSQGSSESMVRRTRRRKPPWTGSVGVF